MSDLSSSFTDREVDHEFDLQAPAWEYEQERSPEVTLVRAETERLVTQASRYPFRRQRVHGLISYTEMTDDELRAFMRGDDDD